MTVSPPPRPPPSLEPDEPFVMPDVPFLRALSHDGLEGSTPGYDADVVVDWQLEVPVGNLR